MGRTRRSLTRGQFLRLSAAAIGGAAAAGATDLGRPLADPAADLLLRNGRVATLDAAGTICQAVAVRDGLILGVGSDLEMSALAGPATRVLDLCGRTVTPGLIDAHCHLELVGLMSTYYTPFLPPEVTSIVELVDRLAAVVAGLSAGQWVSGYYLSLSEGRFPNRWDLDPVSPSHPVWMMHQAGHLGSANSLALALAGITAATADPEGGIIERDDSGEPTGIFYNHRAMDMLRRVIPPFTATMVSDSILSSLPLFAAQGVTGFHQNNIRVTDTIRTFQELARRGHLPLRSLLFYTLEWPQDLDRALNDVVLYEDPHSRFGGYKFLIDGQAPTYYTHQPHAGSSWDMPTWDPTEFRQAVRTLHDTGLQICVHCGGDAAVDLALDAFEAAMSSNPRPDPRHRLEHAILTTPESTRRIRDLGVVVSTQPQFIRMAGDYFHEVLTPEQCARVIMTREWLEAGVVVALGSDAPTTPWLEPQMTLAMAMSRQTASGEVMGADQALTFAEALAAHTVGSAWAGHDEASRGTLEVGKVADLAVWSEDPFAATPRQIYDATFDLTMVGGRVVYEAPDMPRRPQGRVRR